MSNPRGKNPHEHVDGCVCDIELEPHEEISDEELPAADGGLDDDGA